MSIVKFPRNYRRSPGQVEQIIHNLQLKRKDFLEKTSIQHYESNSATSKKQ
ncbi:hypothetical protein J2S21_001067 [Peribacillus cavernae]|nr:hypothetical protein [Peribacillus cavernae]